jgi:hypothetical protein
MALIVHSSESPFFPFGRLTGPHELFDVESRNELVAFRSAHGTYIGLESGGEKLVCSATAAGSSELFQIRLKVPQPGAVVAAIARNARHALIQSYHRPTFKSTTATTCRPNETTASSRSASARGFPPGETASSLKSAPRTAASAHSTIGTASVGEIAISIGHPTHSRVRSRYWVAESNGNLSAVTPASSSRKSAREEFKLEGYRSDLLEPEHIYFGIRTTHGTFVISEDDKIVTGAPSLLFGWVFALLCSGSL